MSDQLAAAFEDLGRPRRLRALVERCRPDGPPRLDLLPAGSLAGARRAAVLAGSFNPLTAAHLALATAAERAGLGPVVFALSTRTVDKERPEGALLEDRLLVLLLHAERRPGRAAALLNRGLYVDQADLFRTALPTLETLTFLVGFDKIVQIFDPRYYTDRERALTALFARAGFAVAPRAGAGRAELEALLARPENRPYAAGVRPLDLPAELAEISSTAVRAALARGGPIPDDLPPESKAFIRATGCYRPARPGPDGRPVDRYAERAARLVGGWVC